MLDTTVARAVMASANCAFMSTMSRIRTRSERLVEILMNIFRVVQVCFGPF